MLQISGNFEDLLLEILLADLHLSFSNEDMFVISHLHMWQINYGDSGTWYTTLINHETEKIMKKSWNFEKSWNHFHETVTRIGRFTERSLVIALNFLLIIIKICVILLHDTLFSMVYFIQSDIRWNQASSESSSESSRFFQHHNFYLLELFNFLILLGHETFEQYSGGEAFCRYI